MLDDTRDILRRVWPAAATLIAAVVLVTSPDARDAVRPLVAPALPVAWGAGLALAARFGRTRVTWTLAVLGLTWSALGMGAAVGVAAATLAPLVIAAVLVAGPASPASLRGVARAVGLVALVLAVRRGMPLVPDALLTRLGGPFGIEAVDTWLAIPAGPALTGALAIGVALIVLVRRRAPLDAAITAGLAVAWASLSAHVTPESRAALALLVATGLLVATIESSYDLAFRDRLTGLLGRRALDEALAQQGRRYTVAMIDVDHFKKFNDRHGHDAGDRVLRAVARRLDRVTGGGRAYRYGGEEFTVVFPRRSAEDARKHLEAVRKAIRATRVTLPRRPGVKPPKRDRRVSVTVSIGAAQRSDDLATPDAVLKEADRALYRAKKAGRNRVEIA